jgi:hypothetical protein
MANGILGSVELAAGTYTPVYLVPEDTFSVVTVSICNKNTTSSITVRLAVAKPDPTGVTAPDVDDYLEYESTILPGGVLERTGIVLDASRNVYARSSAGLTSVMVYGIETATA